MEKKIGPVKSGKRHGLPWERFEMILILNLYFQLPFGKLNHTTQDVRKLALLIQRTDNSVALRLTNYAACDPYILQSGRTGMQSGKMYVNHTGMNSQITRNNFLLKQRKSKPICYIVL